MVQVGSPTVPLALALVEFNVHIGYVHGSSNASSTAQKLAISYSLQGHLFFTVDESDDLYAFSWETI